MPQSQTVKIAGREYEIKSYPILQSRMWRKKLETPFADIASALAGVSLVDISRIGSLGDLIQALGGTLIGSLDTVFDLVCEYSPEINADKEHIEAEGFDEEMIAAFIVILRMVFPLEQLRKLMNGR